MPNTEQTATQIHQDLLDRTGSCLMSGEFDGFHPCFLFPFELETEGGTRLLQMHDDARPIFDAIHTHIVQMRITIFARNSVSASFRHPDQIVATHETRMISDGLLIEESFPALSILQRHADGSWKIRSASYLAPEGSSYQSALRL